MKGKFFYIPLKQYHPLYLSKGLVLICSGSITFPQKYEQGFLMESIHICLINRSMRSMAPQVNKRFDMIKITVILLIYFKLTLLYTNNFTIKKCSN